jgi:hypothetical protein
MSDFNDIQALITQYFDGLHTKDIDAIEQVFWGHAEITGYYEGDFVHSKLNDYLSILKRMSAPNMIGEDFEMHISSIEIIGSIASVKTRYVFQALNYVDFLSLIKIDDVWKIVNKVFYHD